MNLLIEDTGFLLDLADESDRKEFNNLIEVSSLSNEDNTETSLDNINGILKISWDRMYLKLIYLEDENSTGYLSDILNVEHVDELVDFLDQINSYINS